MTINKTGRNDPCPCGSGKKYKQCCAHTGGGQPAGSHPTEEEISNALQAAIGYHQAGLLPQAEAIYQQILQVAPNHPDALHLLGLIASQAGKHELAAELISKALMLVPDFAGAHYNLGNALRDQGNLDEAIASYRKSLALKPDFADAHHNLGDALRDQGLLDEAVASYRKSLVLKPDFAEAYNNLGNVLSDQGQLDEAITSYRKSLALKPDFAEAHYNLGDALRDQGNLDEAVASYRKSLALKPDFAEAHNNLGIALKEQGKLYEAVLSHIRALLISEDAETKLLFAQCVKDVRFTHAEPSIRLLVMRAIYEAWDRQIELLPVAINLIKLNQGIKECVDRAASAWPKRLSKQELFDSSGFASVVDEPLLQCLLKSMPISNMEFEWFLTMARLAMLESAMTEKNSSGMGAMVSGELEDKTLIFYCALARQCFINEYIFAYTDEELAQAESLRERLVSRLTTKADVPVIWLVAVAAYFPLISLPHVDVLLDIRWPDAVAALLVQQVREPLEEQHYRKLIPRLTAIDDDVSLLVKEQYEENPYPRWVRVPCGTKAFTVDAYLHQQFPNSRFHPLGKIDGVDILVAGCGTGRHSIETAQQLCGAKVLAVDLSLASLCYAKRKTQEVGSLNIEYAQADIMELGAISQTFDIVESIGVLHHLADPVAGWRVLLSLLRPGGLMRLGFYSALARQHIIAARGFIAELGYAANAVDIRQCRQELMSKKNVGQFKQLLSWPDFYAMSDCRDLLFHVQEHCYTLLQLKEILGALGLCFVGFTLDNSTAKQYTKRFPDDQAKTNLDYWHLFETENPNTFSGMYQFWVQKN